MERLPGNLKNSNLIETIIPAKAYNALPFIEERKNEYLLHRSEEAILRDMILQKGLGDIFSVHLVHKYIDCHAGQVVVYEPLERSNRPGLIVREPRDPTMVQGLRGIHFIASPYNTMVAYEYTTEPGKDLSEYSNFVSDYASTAKALGVDDIFGLRVVDIVDHDRPAAMFETAKL
jgi:hypothetical protein